MYLVPMVVEGECPCILHRFERTKLHIRPQSSRLEIGRAQWDGRSAPQRNELQPRNEILGRIVDEQVPEESEYIFFGTTSKLQSESIIVVDSAMNYRRCLGAYLKMDCILSSTNSIREKKLNEIGQSKDNLVKPLLFQLFPRTNQLSMVATGRPFGLQALLSTLTTSQLPPLLECILHID